MSETQSYIESGILEAYVLGSLNDAEILEVESKIATNQALLAEIEKISEALESFARINAVAPDPTIKPFLFATIDYTERIENGETVTFLLR